MDAVPDPPLVAERTPDAGLVPPPPAFAPAPTRRSLRRARERERPAVPGTAVDVDVLVIGAGQAGLSAAYHLRKAGFVPVGAAGWDTAERTFVVLDASPGPGGAWQERWPGMTMADAHAVHELPGMPLVVVDPAEPARAAVPYYFAQYEDAYGLHVQRPVVVSAVRDDGAGRLLVSSHVVDRPDEAVSWRARGLVNASGTWRKPFWPAYPGVGVFRGRQLHARDFVSPEALADGHVVVVGGGTSAVQLLLAVAEVTTTTWVTRRPPAWRDEQFTPELGRAAVALVDERTRAGLPPGSVVSVTGLPLTPAYRAGIESGVLRARPMFSRLTADAAVWDDVTPPPVPAADDGLDGLGGWVAGPAEVPARTILWCTGYRASLDHLAPLRLRGPGGGIVMAGTQVAADPRLQLVGYGPSASTIGANRAGREAVQNLERMLP
ncbi:NAD(P)-binding domain-containing protein [Cellulomonas composti]|uniref:Oxidoreductase n=1 Tax=Cellulomonas composti TaxID=266130 RepID=A0A511JCV9_9CELL|nr:NAD(P)-binding domain-containing protein [Cellulomonas composti]GEL95776.1 oxidoreductase [Cellulomonas composti]